MKKVMELKVNGRKIVLEKILLETGERGVVLTDSNYRTIAVFRTMDEFKKWLKEKRERAKELIEEHGQLYVEVIQSLYMLTLE